MALKKPVVIGSDGSLQQIQAGDTLDVPVAQTNVRSVANGETGAITVGMPVYISAADTVKKAANSASGTSKVHGVVYEASISASTSGAIATDGPVTSSDWTAVTGSTTLTVGADYFLDSVAGRLTATVPTSAGAYLVKVGTAVSTTTLEVSVRDRILL